MTREPRPDNEAMDEPSLEHMIRLLDIEHRRLAIELDGQELDPWHREIDEAQRTREYGSTARQCELIQRDCEQLLSTPPETVMRTCFECPDIDAEKDARHIRRLHEAWSLWYMTVYHEWEFDYGGEPAPDPD